MQYRLAVGLTCPFSHAVKVALTHLGVPHETRFVDPSHPPEWLRQEVPGGQVPALWVDGRVVWESLAICDLVDRQREGGLWPQDPVDRAEAWAWAALAGALLADWHAFAQEDAGGPGSTTEAGRRLMDRFARIEVRMGYGPYFLGPRFSIVDAAFAPLLLRLRLHGGDALLGDRFPRMDAWADRVCALPEVADAMPAEWEDAVRRRLGATPTLS